MMLRYRSETKCLFDCKCHKTVTIQGKGALEIDKLDPTCIYNSKT